MTTPAKFWIQVAAWGGLLVVLAGVIGYALFPDAAKLRAGERPGTGRANRASSGSDADLTLIPRLPIVSALPEFDLTERSGRRVTRGDLRGHVWIADFVFTHCAGPCPKMTQRMAGLQKELAADDKLLLVSFSVDPLRDTPEVLRPYADGFGADPKRWWFLTTEDEAAMRRLALDGFRIVARSSTSEERREGMDDILHSTYFVLVDTAGRVRGVYDSLDEERVGQLLIDARALYRAGGR